MAAGAFDDDFLGAVGTSAAQNSAPVTAAVPDVLGFLAEDPARSILAEPPAPAPAKTFAQLDLGEAEDRVLVIAAQNSQDSGLVLESNGAALLREEVHSWLEGLRKAPGPAKTQLMSVGVRDAACARVVDQILKRASRSAAGACSIPLPSGRQIVIAPSSVVAEMGLSVLIRCAHEQAVFAAHARGEAHNEHALAHYRAKAQQESM